MQVCTALCICRPLIGYGFARPFCLQRFEDGIGAVPEAAEREMKVYDVVELLDMAVAPAPATPEAAKADSPQDQAAEPPQ